MRKFFKENSIKSVAPKKKPSNYLNQSMRIYTPKCPTQVIRTEQSSTCSMKGQPLNLSGIFPLQTSPVTNRKGFMQFNVSKDQEYSARVNRTFLDSLSPRLKHALESTDESAHN